MAKNKTNSQEKKQKSNPEVVVTKTDTTPGTEDTTVTTDEVALLNQDSEKALDVPVEPVIEDVELKTNAPVEVMNTERGEGEVGVTIDEAPWLPNDEDVYTGADDTTERGVVINEADVSFVQRDAGAPRAVDGFTSIIPVMTRNVPALAEALNTFIAEFTPNSGSNEAQQVSAQVRFFNNLVDFFNHAPDGVREINNELVEVFRRYKDGACSLAKINRNMHSIPLTTAQRDLYGALVHLYRTAGTQGRRAAALEVDVPEVASRYRTAYPRSVNGPSILSELFKE